MRPHSFLCSLFLVVLILAGPTMAEMPLKLGVVGGAGITDFNGDDLTGTDSHTGIVAGLSVETGITKDLSIEMQALYSRKGAEKTIEGDEILWWKYLFDYVEIPVLLTYNAPVTGNVRPSLFVGPSLAISTDATLKADLGSWAGDLPVSNAKSTYFGMIAGAGVEFALGQVGLGLQMRYQVPVSEFLEDEDPPVFFDPATLSEVPLVNWDGSAWNVKHSGFELLLTVSLL